MGKRIFWLVVLLLLLAALAAYFSGRNAEVSYAPSQAVIDSLSSPSTEVLVPPREQQRVIRTLSAPATSTPVQAPRSVINSLSAPSR